MANNRIDMTVGLKVDKSGLTQLKKSLQDIQNLTTRDLMNINGNNFNKAKEDLKTVKSQAEKVEAALKSAFNPKLGTVNVETFNNVLKKSSGSIETIYSNFKKAGASGEAAFRNMASQLAKVQTQVKQTHGWLDKMAITFANTVKWNISSSVFNSLTGSVQQAWNFTKALDSSLNDIRIVTGKSADEMDRFAERANAVAKNLGTTTKDYTNAALIYAQQGLGQKEIEEKTAITLKTAKVTGQSAEAVSEQLTAVWNGYRVGAEEAEIYVDRLAAVAAKSASNLQELATGMSKVASAAATMGVSEEQLAAQLSTIISVTRQAPESVGVALKTVYARMSDIKAGLDEDGVSLGNYSGKMAAFGINVLDMSGNLRDMGEVIEEIGGKWGAMTREQQISLAQTMGGQRQYSNLVALFDNFDKYQNMIEVAQGAEGTLEKQNETQMDRLTTHITKMTAATEKLFMTLVDSDGFKTLIDIFTKLIDLTSGFVDSVGGLGPILGVLGGIGAKTFGTDIAKSLTETITNLRQGKQEAQDFSEQIKTLQEMKSVKSLSEEDKQYIEAQQNRLKQMPSMTEQQKTEITAKIEELNAKIKTLQSLEEQKQTIDQTLRSLGKIDGKIMGFSDLNEEDSVSKLQEALEKKESAYKDFSEKIKKLSEETRQAFEDTDYSESQIKVAEQRVKVLKAVIQEAKNNSDMDSEEFQGYLKKLEKSLGTYEAKVNRVKSSLQANQFDQMASDADIIKQENLPDLLQIEGTFEGFTEKIKRRIAQIKKQFSEMAPDFAEELQNGIKQAKAGVEGVEENTEAFLDKINTQKAVQGFVDMAGGISQIYAGLSSISNLGDVWGQAVIKQSDVTIGEAFLKTLSSLVFILPSLTAGFNAVSSGLKAIKTVQISTTLASKILGETIEKGTAIKLKDVIVAKLLGVSIKDVGDKSLFTALKSVTLTGAFKALGTAAKGLLASLGPVGIALGAITLAATAFSLINNAIEANRQASIEANNKIIEQEKEKQQQYEKTKDGVSALKQLNSQYQNEQISVTELKTKTQELAEQYKIEDQLIKTLTEDYSKFGETLDSYSDRILENQVKSAKRARISAGINVKNAVEETGDSTSWFTNLFSSLNGYTVSSVGVTSNESNLIWEKYLKDLDFVSYDLERDAIDLLLSHDPKKAKQQYEKLSEVISQFTQEQANSAVGQFFIKQTTAIEDSINKYSEAVSFQLEKAAEKSGNQFADEFSNVKSVEEYSKVRDAFVTELAELQQISEEQAAKAVDAYLRTYQKQLYNKFSLREILYKKLKEASGSDASEEQAQLLDNLSQDKLITLQNIKFDNWEEFYNICSKLDNVDLSNLFISDISTDNIKAAKDQFDFYQSFADQMASSKKNTIGEKQFKSLDSDIQEFFLHTAQGTYKLKAGAIQFYDAVTRKSRESLEQVTEDSVKRQNQLLGISAMLTNGEGTDGYSAYNNAISADDNTKLQLIADQGWGLNEDDSEERQKRAVKWAAAIQHGGQEATKAVSQMNEVLKQNSKLLNSDLVDQYVKKTEQASKKSYAAQYELGMTAKDTAELKTFFDQGKIGIDAYNAAYVNLKKQTEDKILDPKEVSEYADHLQKIAENSKDLSNDLKENRKDALALASEIMKMNKGIQNLAKNWKNWGSILRKSSDGSQEFGEALEGTADALALITGMDKAFFDEEFVKANLDNIEKVANGDEKAIQRVKDAAAQKILLTITGRIEDEKLKAQMLKLGEDVLKKGQEISNTLKVGAQLDPTKQKEFIEDLNKLIETTGMTTGQLNSMLSDIGFQPVFSTEAQPVETEIPETITRTKVELGRRRIEIPGFKIPLTDIDIPGTSFDIPLPNISTDTVKTGETKKVTQMEVPSLSTNGKAAPIKSLRKKATPSMNNYSSKNKGGSSPSGKSGGSGGKKGGSGNKADKSQKDTKKTDKKQQDIYHDINIELKDINRALERTQKIQEKLYGKELLDNLQKQSDLLDEHIKKLREKEALQKTDLKNKQAELKTLGMAFDEYGHITNYLEKLIAHQNKINKLTEEYNALVKKYNASTNKATKEKINEQITAKDKQIKQAEEAKKETEEKIKDYEELQDAREELLDQIEEELDKQTEIAIKKFRMQLEVRLETGDAEREWNDFKRNVLNADNILKDTSFTTIMKDAQNSFENFGSYFDVAGAKGSITTLTQQIKATKQQIEDIDKLGESAIYGKNKALAMEDLKNDLSDLMSQLEEVQELIKALDQAYLDGMADIKEQYDNRQEQLSFIGELVQHDMDLLGIIFGSKNYAAMQKYYETLRQNQLGQIGLLKEESNYWKNKWEQALQNGNINAAKQFENNYKDSINNLNSLLDTAAQTLKDKYLNAIDAIFDQINNKLTSGKGLDYLDLEWDLINKNAESYLDKINSAYAIQDFQNKSTKAINDAKGLKNQQALKKVSEEQLKILRNKDKLTQYDVDRADKMLELEKARLALEEARQNKTSLRLKRDSQGNYSYQYVSDNNKILEAQEALAKAQNELFNFDAQKLKDNLKEFFEAWKECQEKIHSIRQDETLSEQEQNDQLKLVKDEYETYITNKLRENLSIRQNLMKSAFDEYSTLYNLDAQKFANMSAAEKDVIMNQLVPQWDSGIADMINRLNGDGEQQGLTQVWEDTFEQIKNKGQEFKQEQAELFKEAGINPEDLQNASNPIVNIYSDLIGTNKEFLDQLKEEKSTLENVASQAGKLKEQYKGIFEYAKKVAEQVQKFRTEQEKATAAAAQAADKTRSKANAQADTKAAQQKAQQTVAKGTTTSVSKAGANGGRSTQQLNNPSQQRATVPISSNLKDANLEKIKSKLAKIKQQQKNFKEKRLKMGTAAFYATNADKGFISSIEKLKKDLDSYVGKVSKKNKDKAKNYQEQAAKILSEVKTRPEAKYPVFNALNGKFLTLTGIKGGISGSQIYFRMENVGSTLVPYHYYRKRFDPNTKKLTNVLQPLKWSDGGTIQTKTLNTDKNFFKRFDTGGYTGNWADKQGRLALLHKKQLVLNAKDTENMLDMIKITKKTLEGLRSKSPASLSSLRRALTANQKELEQNVHITATFPNVNSKREIEQAFNDLINLAAQRALKRF